jgi:DNA polymerase-3 subunit delta'
MRKEAANAFLKTLEEPPQGTYLFLLTTRPYSILPTIRSRTLMVRLEENSTQEKNQELENWIAHYSSWVELLMDRKKLKQDRVSPVFMAYGLIESLANLIKSTADDLTKKALSNLPDEVEDKEKDAFESGLRRGVRTKMLKVISDCTRSLITGREGSSSILEHNGLKLTRVIRKLESTSGLLEVNLKEDAALEDFFLSSLRIWSSK